MSKGTYSVGSFTATLSYVPKNVGHLVIAASANNKFTVEDILKLISKTTISEQLTVLDNAFLRRSHTLFITNPFATKAVMNLKSIALQSVTFPKNTFCLFTRALRYSNVNRLNMAQTVKINSASFMNGLLYAASLEKLGWYHRQMRCDSLFVLMRIMIEEKNQLKQGEKFALRTFAFGLNSREFHSSLLANAVLKYFVCETAKHEMIDSLILNRVPSKAKDKTALSAALKKIPEYVRFSRVDSYS